MNIEIADRLVRLRKENNLSQEALAEKLGISRQAVSKWERAEASPDTDNLILLSKLYQVSLDELLKTEENICGKLKEEAAEGREKESEKMTDTPETEESDYFHIGYEGIRLKDKDGSAVHIGAEGIHIEEGKGNETVHIDEKGVFINGRKYNTSLLLAEHFPFSLIITIFYIIMGAVFNAWHPSWLLFLLIPLWYSFVEALKKGNALIFAYPVLTALLFLCGGFFWGNWHPGWLVFLTIPVYYLAIGFIQGLIKGGNTQSTYDTDR